MALGNNPDVSLAQARDKREEGRELLAAGDVFPIIGHRPVAQFEAPELVAMVKLIERRGALACRNSVRQ